MKSYTTPDVLIIFPVDVITTSGGLYPYLYEDENDTPQDRNLG